MNMTIDAQYRSLVKRLEERTIVIEEDGLKKLFKQIPDVDKRGVLDPRVLKIYQSMPPFAATFGKKDEEEGEAQPSSTPEFSIENIRKAMGWPNHDLSTGVTTIERTIPGSEVEIPVRIYTPSNPGLKPAIIFFHGGGFFGGSLGAVENPCKGLAEKAGAVVISVDYRLAPEHPFPAGLVDCWDTVQWVHNNAEELSVDANWIAVSGDSAGGNLSAACTVLDLQNNTNYIKYQALIYPTVCMAEEHSFFQWSIDAYERNEEIELMTTIATGLAPKKGENMVRQMYLPQEIAPEDPRVSPIFFDRKDQLPPALVVTAEFDGLKVEGETYAKLLAKAGVDTTYLCYQGMDHAFMDKYGIYPQAEDLMNEIAKGYRAVIQAS